MPKPKHLRGKKPRKGGNGGKGGGTPPPPANPAATVSTLDRIFDFARVDEDANARAVYPAIIGKEGSITDLSLANVGQLKLVEEAVAAALMARIAEADAEWAVRTTLVEVTPGSKSEVDVPKCRKALRFYAKAGVDAIVTIITAPVPLASDPTGFGIALQVRAVVFGANARASVQLADMKARVRGGSPSRTATVWYAANDEETLRKALRDMFRPSWIDLPGLDNDVEAGVPEGWNKASSRRRRGFHTLMVRSMLPAKKAFGFVGEGKSVMVGALTAAEVAMKRARRTSPPPVHPDGVPHYWFGELRRLDLEGIAVPLIKLR